MRSWLLFIPLLLVAAACAAQEYAGPAAGSGEAASGTLSAYTLGPEDQIVIRAMEAGEITDKPVPIGMDGYIKLPLVGRIRASGLTVRELEAVLAARLKAYIREPDVSVTVVEFRSQPVSVIGCVKNPGVHQLQGHKTLIEMLSLAGGLTDDAGPSVKITRMREWGRIPLPDAVDDASGQFSVAEAGLKAILTAASPERNIVIRPHDVISVPRADMIYVTGQVVRSGGFVLNDRESISVLQALALAGGLDRTASPQNARVLRLVSGAPSRREIPVDVKKIFESKAEDIALMPDDILFVPTSVPKKAALRALETAIQVGTGIVIWRR